MNEEPGAMLRAYVVLVVRKWRRRGIDGDFHGGVPYRGDVLPLAQFSEVNGQAERVDCKADGILADNGTGAQSKIMGSGDRLFFMGGAKLTMGSYTKLCNENIT